MTHVPSCASGVKHLLADGGVGGGVGLSMVVVSELGQHTCLTVPVVPVFERIFNSFQYLITPTPFNCSARSVLLSCEFNVIHRIFFTLYSESL